MACLSPARPDLGRRMRPRTFGASIALALLALAGCGDERAGAPSEDATSGASSGTGGETGTGGASGGEGSAGAPTGGGGSGGEGGGAPKPPPRVLLIGPDPDLWVTDLQQRLVATGAFETVDVFDIGFPFCPSDLVPPTLDELQGYDVAFVLFLSLQAFATSSLGDVLADYYDEGGRVVLSNSWIFGRFTGRPCTVSGCGASCGESEAYSLFTSPGWVGEEGEDGIGEVAEPESPLLVDVDTLSYTMRTHKSGMTLAPGAKVVASWSSDGEPMIVRGEILGRKRVDLNLTAVSAEMWADAGWTGDGAELVRNALLWGWED